MENFKEKLIDEIDLRGLRDKTKFAYIESLTRLIKFYQKSLEQLDIEDIKNYQLYLIRNEKKYSSQTINRHLSGIKFFYRYVLKKKWDFSELPRLKRKNKLPQVFSEEEVRKLIESVRKIKYKAILMTLYSTGMRVSELINLRGKDIDSKRMIISIRDGKGGKDRQVILSSILLECLREYWVNRDNKNSEWLFGPPANSKKSKNFNKKLTARGICYLLKIAAKAAGIKKRVNAHAFRHSFAVHLLEGGTSLRHIQYLLGHSSINTTAIYTQIINFDKVKIKSPLDNLFSLKK